MKKDQLKVWVRYIGKADMITTEFNQKRYCFTKKRPVQLIPQEVFDFIKSSRSLHINSIIVCDAPIDENQGPASEETKDQDEPAKKKNAKEKLEDKKKEKKSKK